jgi:aspartate 1-decarboxylase
MYLNVLKAKLHRATVTHSELEYEGSCAIDGTLLDAAGIHEYEQIQIYNIDNGERFTTYAIRARERSGIISINGAAAHKASPGDRVIICSYASIETERIMSHRPTLIYLDSHNRITRVSHEIPMQAA